MAFALDYDQMIPLDAEDLAETGLKEAYESMLLQLKQYVSEPVGVDEHIDSDAARYMVVAGGIEYIIQGDDLDETGSWGRATHALFAIVNRQLAHSGIAFYAINGGNDLGGMFLTSQQAEKAKRSLPRKTDWPYLPTDECPWYGQPQ